MKKLSLLFLILSVVLSGTLSAQTELSPAARLAKETYAQSSPRPLRATATKRFWRSGMQRQQMHSRRKGRTCHRL